MGVNIGMFNCPGWSQSGGPWIKPEQAMRYLVSSETRVHGPGHFEQKLAQPEEQFQDVAVLAFPAPAQDGNSIRSHSPRVACTPAVRGADQMVDGRLDTALAFPAGAGQGGKTFTIDLNLTEPFTARSLSLIPSASAWAAQCELEAANRDGSFQPVKSFKFDRSNMGINVGPMPRGPVTVSFAPTTAKQFRLVFTGVTGRAALAEVNLSAAARLESFVEKQLGKMHPTPQPMWGTYLWPRQTEPDSPKLTIAPGQVVNLAAKLAADGTLRWDVPAGDWIILRTGMTPTGTRNSPASPEGQGLEVDKMNRAAAKAHFDAFIGQVLERMPASERKAFKQVVADSYEMGSENWTDGFAQTFRQRYGYDPMPWLPVLTGRIVGTADESNRFLWDLRRLVADRIATDYVGGLRDLCHAHGLQLWLENYGHWGFPAEFLQYGEPIGPHRRRVLGDGLTRFHRVPRCFVVREHLRQTHRFGGGLHRRAAVSNRAVVDESARRLGLLRRHQSFRPARLYRAAVGRSCAGRQRLVRHRVQPAQHLVRRGPRVDRLPAPLRVSSCSRAGVWRTWPISSAKTRPR